MDVINIRFFDFTINCLPIKFKLLKETANWFVNQRECIFIYSWYSTVQRTGEGNLENKKIIFLNLIVKDFYKLEKGKRREISKKKKNCCSCCERFLQIRLEWGIIIFFIQRSTDLIQALVWWLTVGVYSLQYWVCLWKLCVVYFMSNNYYLDIMFTNRLYMTSIGWLYCILS